MDPGSGFTLINLELGRVTIYQCCGSGSVLPDPESDRHLEHADPDPADPDRHNFAHCDKNYVLFLQISTFHWSNLFLITYIFPEKG